MIESTVNRNGVVYIQMYTTPFYNGIIKKKTQENKG